MGKLQDPSIVAGAPPQKAAEAAEEGAGVVELLHRMERRLVGIEALIDSTLGGVGVVAAGLLAIRKCRRAATARAAPRGRG